MLEAKKPVRVIAKDMGKTLGCVRKNIQRLGIVVAHAENQSRTTTSNFVLPEELPSVLEASKVLAATMEALKTSGLDKSEFCVYGISFKPRLLTKLKLRSLSIIVGLNLD